METANPRLVAVQLLDGSEEAFRAVIEALDPFMTYMPPWPGARAAQGLPDDWKWVLQVSPHVFTASVHLRPPWHGNGAGIPGRHQRRHASGKGRDPGQLQSSGGEAPPRQRQRNDHALSHCHSEPESIRR